MKKVMICLMLLLLTGCQSINEVRDTDKMNHSLTVINQIEEVVTYVDDEWEVLQEELLQLQREGEQPYKVNSNYKYSTREGVAFSDGMLCIDDISGEENKKATGLIGAKLGKEFEALMGNTDMLEAMEYGEIKETIIGTYGVVLKKIKNDRYDGFDLYLCKSSLMLKDEKEQAWLQEICNDDILLSAVSQGTEGRLIELSTPSYLMIESLYTSRNISTYYQVFKENYGDIRKIRMVLRQRQQAEGKIPENQVGVLKRLVSSASGEEIDISGLCEAIESRLSDNSGVKKGTVGKLSYSITQESNSVYQGKMIVVELEPNKA